MTPPAPVRFSTTKGWPEIFLQNAADLAGGDVSRPTGAEGDEDPDRPRRIIFRAHGRAKESASPASVAVSANANPLNPAFLLPLKL